MLGVTVITVKRYEKGNIIPPLHRIESIINIFGISKEELLNGVGKSFAESKAEILSRKMKAILVIINDLTAEEQEIIFSMLKISTEIYKKNNKVR